MLTDFWFYLIIIAFCILSGGIIILLTHAFIKDAKWQKIGHESGKAVLAVAVGILVLQLPLYCHEKDKEYTGLKLQELIDEVKAESVKRTTKEMLGLLVDKPIGDALEFQAFSDKILYKNVKVRGTFHAKPRLGSSSSDLLCLSSSLEVSRTVKNRSSRDVDYDIYFHFRDTAPECGRPKLLKIKLSTTLDENLYIGPDGYLTKKKEGSILIKHHEFRKKIDPKSKSQRIKLRSKQEVKIVILHRINTGIIDRFSFANAHPTTDMSFEIRFPENLKVTGHILHPAGLMRGKQKRKFARWSCIGQTCTAHVTTGLLPFQSVEFSWEPKKVKAPKVNGGGE